jgi:hypothetical protein
MALTLHSDPKAAAARDEPKPKLALLEHDHRFGVFPEFTFYDFMQPMRLPGAVACLHPGTLDFRTPGKHICADQNSLCDTAHLKGSIDRIICDPPFLSEDCQTKGMLRWLADSHHNMRLKTVNS